MYKDNGISDLIYEYLHTCLSFNRYPYGTPFPSIHEIAMRFHVAKETVRKIYKRLACEGFIRMDERKQTISCYHKKEDTSYTLAYFHNYRYLYEDLLQSTSLLFSNIMQEAAKALTKKDRQKILAILDDDQQYHLENITHICLIYLAKLHNELIISFFLQLIHFLRFPYLLHHDMINDLDFLFAEKTSILILKDKLTHYPNSPWKDTYINMPARYIHYFQAYLDAHPIQQQKSATIPFQWSLQHRHSQQCYSIATALLVKLDDAEYVEGTYLPSHHELVQSLQVSNSTIRRALDLLDGMGIIKTKKGKGRYVYTACNDCDIAYERSSVQKMLKQYQQSLSFLELIVPAVITQLPMHATFDFTHLKQLVEKQEEYLMGYAILQQLLKVSELVVVKECMRTLYQIQLWGKQLSHALQMQQHDKTITQYACSFMQAIEKQDYTTAAQSAYALFHAQTTATTTWLHAHLIK